MTNNTYFAQTAISGAIITGLAQAIKIGLQFISIIVFAWLLVPEDFGLLASVAPLLAFVALFQDIGLQQAIIQRKNISEDQLSRIFWIMVILGALCTLFVILSSPAVSWFYNDPRLHAITIGASLPIILYSMGALPMSLMNRNLRFHAIAYINIITSVSGFLAAVIAALLGAGYWSFIIASSVIAITGTFSAFIISGWRPRKPRFGIEKDIFSFGANLTGFNVVSFFALNLDNVLIGKYQGSTQLGYYDLAYKLLLFPIRTINEPISRVIIPILSKVQDDKERVRRIYLRTIGLMMLAIIPAIATLTIVSEEVILIAFGEKWLDVAPIFSWLGVASLIQIMGNSTGWIFISQGKTNAMLKWGIYSAITTCLAFIIGIKWGVVGIAASYAIVSYALQFPVLYYIMGKVGPVKTSDYLVIQLPLLVAAAITWAIVSYLFENYMQFSGIYLIAITLFTSYFVALLISMLHPLGRNSIFEAISLLQKLLRAVGRFP